MSMPMTSATSGSSTRRCTSSAPHHLATPVTRMRLFLGTNPESTQAHECRFCIQIRGRGPGPGPVLYTKPFSVGALDHVALHLRDRLGHHVAQRLLGLAQGPFQLAQQ